MSVTPASTERVRDLLSLRDFNFGEHSEAELVVSTRNAVYLWNTSDLQILRVRAQWCGIAEDDTQFSALVDEIAGCNSTRSGPRAYLALLEDLSHCGLIAECNVVAMDGLTQAQLDGFYETSLPMIMGFFADLEKTLPDFVTQADDAENTNDAGDATEQAKLRPAASVTTVEEDQG